MGQAKQRGTSETRVALANARNAKMEVAIRENEPLQKFQRKHGTQRLATVLTMAGLMSK